MVEDSKFIRAFIAFYPPEAVKIRLEQMQRSLKYPLARAGITWVKPDQLDLTLKFLADITMDSLPALKDAIATACQTTIPLLVRTEGLGVFPHQRKPRVIWVGLNGQLASLLELQARIEATTAAWREPEKRVFHPHLTLGRIRQISGQQMVVLAKKLSELAAADFGEFRVQQIDLMQSHLSGAGVTYTRLMAFPLAGVAESPTRTEGD